MTKLLSLLCLALLLAIVGSANAGTTDKPSAIPAPNEPPPRPAVQFGVRAAVAIEATGSPLIGTTFTSDVMLDLRISNRVVLTPYFGFARGDAGHTVAEACERANVSCTVTGNQAGGILRVSYARTARADAWVGYAFSREWREAGSGQGHASFSGFDHHVVAGLDFFTHASTKIGFFGEVSSGGYEYVSVTMKSGLQPSGNHRWASFGFQVVL